MSNFSKINIYLHGNTIDLGILEKKVAADLRTKKITIFPNYISVHFHRFIYSEIEFKNFVDVLIDIVDKNKTFTYKYIFNSTILYEY